MKYDLQVLVEKLEEYYEGFQDKQDLIKELEGFTEQLKKQYLSTLLYIANVSQLAGIALNLNASATTIVVAVFATTAPTCS